MNPIAFDTHKYVKRLIAAGMTEEQAEAIADEQRALIDAQLATKRDLAELQTRLKHNIKEMEHSLTLRLGGMLVVGIGVVAALQKIL